MISDSPSGDQEMYLDLKGTCTEHVFWPTIYHFAVERHVDSFLIIAAFLVS